MADLVALLEAYGDLRRDTARLAAQLKEQQALEADARKLVTDELLRLKHTGTVEGGGLAVKLNRPKPKPKFVPGWLDYVRANHPTEVQVTVTEAVRPGFEAAVLTAMASAQDIPEKLAGATEFVSYEPREPYISATPIAEPEQQEGSAIGGPYQSPAELFAGAQVLGMVTRPGDMDE